MMLLLFLLEPTSWVGLQITLRCASLRACDLGPGADLKLKQMHVSSNYMSTICWQGFRALSDIHLACPGLTSVCTTLLPFPFLLYS